MYIILFSENRGFSVPFLSYVDKLITKNKYYNLNIYSFSPFSAHALSLKPEPDSFFYILIDHGSYSDIFSVLHKLNALFPHYCAGILTTQNTLAVKLLNTAYPLFGFLNISKPCYLNHLPPLLSCLNQMYPVFSKGLCIKTTEKISVLSYPDIFYIETEKGTHRCAVYHSEGTHFLRGNIKDLISFLDDRFLVVRSSTIANISAVREIDIKNRLLLFQNGLACSYTQAFFPKIKSKLESKYSTVL